MVSGSLQIGIRQQLPDPRYLREKAKKLCGMQKRDKLRAAFPEICSGAQIKLPDVIVVVTNPPGFARRKDFLNDTVEQNLGKQTVDNQMRKWLGRSINGTEGLSVVLKANRVRKNARSPRGHGISIPGIVPRQRSFVDNTRSPEVTIKPQGIHVPAFPSDKRTWCQQL